MTIGERIRSLRKQNKLSQEKLGEICGVTKGMVSQWESGSSTPPIDKLIRLREKIEFCFDWMLTGRIGPAAEIEQSLTLEQKQAWYRVGRALSEPESKN